MRRILTRIALATTLLIVVAAGIIITGFKLIAKFIAAREHAPAPQ